MRRHLMLLTISALFTMPAAAALCKKCVAGNCESTQYSYKVNCMSNGTTCYAWTDCAGDLGADPCGTPGHPPCDPACVGLKEQYRLARVDVRPAPRAAERWVLAHVQIEPPDARAVP